MRATIVLGALALLVGGPVLGSSLWDKTKEVAGSAAEIVGETATGVGKAIQGDKESPDQVRANIDAASSQALGRLFTEVPEAQARFDSSVAYAVFDTRKMSLLITTGYGSGVAVHKDSGARTYMKMATGGLNLGYGAQFYQVVFLFPDNNTFNDFVNNGWSADAQADAVAGHDASSAALRLENGVSVYELNDKGVMLSATLTGTRYWKDGDLN